MSRPAFAFGGFWSSPTAPLRPTAEEVLFVSNPDETVTAVVRVQYVGPPQKFVWVIPLPGKPKVGVSSNTFFQRLDAATAPRYWVEVAVEGACTEKNVAPDAGNDAKTSGHGSASMSVSVVDQGSVGPYDYATIKVDPAHEDPVKSATAWFRANGFDTTDAGNEVLLPYLKDGLNLLAFKLASGADAGAIRPVVLTYESKRAVIPIGPMAPSASEDLGILIWVIGPSQAVPANSKSLVINDARIDWLSARTYATGTLPAGGVGPFDPHYVGKPSNYDALVKAAAHEAGGQGFVTELGAPASEYRTRVWSPLDQQQFARLSNQSYADGVDAIVTASNSYGGWDGFGEAIRGATVLPGGVTVAEFARNPNLYRGTAKVDAAKFFRLLDREAIRPLVDTAELLSNGPYLTRFYGTTTRAQMTVDPAFDYNPDLALVSNIHIAKQYLRCGRAQRAGGASWRMDLPQGGMMADKSRREWPAAAGAMPANLKVVQLSTTGPGTVVKDNSDEIANTLLRLAGTRESRPVSRPPQNGVIIGGTQTITPRARTASKYESAPRSGGKRCSVSHPGTGTDARLARWLLPVGGIFARRRRTLAARHPIGPREASS